MDFHFWCEGVAILLIALIGFVGNIAMIVNYAKRTRRRILDQLILTICIFDMLTLLMICHNFSLFNLSQANDFEYPEISTFLTPYSLFLAGVSIYGSIYGTLCLCLERYLLVTNLKIHRKLSGLKMIMPVVIFSIITNIHRLFMLSTLCVDFEEEYDWGSGFEYDSDLNLNNTSLFCEEGEKLLIIGTPLRLNLY